MDEKKSRQMIEDFGSMVKATEQLVRPWKIATGILAVALLISIILHFLPT